MKPAAVMGAFLLPYAWLVTYLMACRTNPPPAPDVVPGGLPTAVVDQELVEAGCLEADDSGEGLATIAVMHLDGGTPWLECLFAGGSIGSCAVPCDGPSARKQ